MFNIDPRHDLTVPIRKVVYLHTARMHWPDGTVTTATHEEDISHLFTPEALAQRERDRQELVLAATSRGLWRRWFKR